MQGQRASILPLDHYQRLACLEGAKLRKAWGDFIGRYCWDVWATVTPQFADYSARSLQREIKDGFIRCLARHTRRRCPFMGVIERTSAGVFHGHLFIAGTASLTLSEVRAAWRIGHSDVERYDATRGAAYYSAKTFHLDNDEWETFACSKRMPRSATWRAERRVA